MKIIDFHAHCYPEDVWPKVASAITAAYGVGSAGPGTVEGLLGFMEKAGVSLSVVHPVANRPKHVDSVNDWVLSVRDKHPGLLFFAAIHPGIEDPYETVCDLSAMGFRGVKMQPNAGGYYPNSPECFRIYEALQENGMILLSHAGDELKPFKPLYSHPRYFTEVLESFPDLSTVLAHLGGYNTWDDLDLVLGYDNVYYDTAMSCELGDERFLELVERIGVDWVLFGTDYPWYDTKKAVEYTVDVLGVNSRKVLFDNAARVLDIEL